MTPSLKLLGATDHSADWKFFNHLPEKKPWALMGRYPNDFVRAVVALYMGPDFPIESIEEDILAAINTFSTMNVEDGMNAYLESVGREGRLLLAAIRRNFTRRPHLWDGVRS